MTVVNFSNPPEINELPDDVLLEIFSHLDSTVLRIAVVCKRWRDLSDNEGLHERIFYRELVFFGPEEWKKNFGDPGTVPNISYKQAVKEAFVFASKWPEEWDKKMVWLQPKEILPLGEPEGSVPVTPKKIGELVGKKLGGPCDQTGYRYFWPPALQKYGDTAVQESCWVYMTPDVVPESKGKSYDVQKKQAEDFGGEVPELVDTVTGIFLKASCTGKRLFSDAPWTYTCCKESVQGTQLSVGGFAPAGLGVSGSFDDGGGDGVAAALKFKDIGH